MKVAKPKKSDVVALYRNEAFDNGFYQYFKNLNKVKISGILNSKERNIKFETISYRELNSWEKAGLLNVEREGREWRRFSIMDAIWVKLIKELREFGVTWKQLKVTKDSLEFESERCGVPMPMLEFYTAFVIAQRMPVVILVFKNGIAIPVSLTQFKVAKETTGVANHVQISLNDLIQGMVPEIDLKPIHTAEMPLDVDEMELLAFLRFADYEKVEIKYKDGKIDMIEGTEREMTQKVHDVINQKCYEEIKIRKRDDGVVTSVVRTRKKKLGN
jgi:hypothetical protein